MRQALTELAPELLLIEGPPESTPLLAEVANDELVPPVAILHYDADRPERYVHSPYAEFSPEWQAFRYGVAQGVEMRMIDLPVRYQLALADRLPGEEVEAPPDDPLAGLARLAGDDDPEQWWERLIERRAAGGEIFPAIHEAMRELRRGQSLAAGEAWREAWMRREVRLAAASGRRVAVVCGAWHVPALDPEDPNLPNELEDEHLLAGLAELTRRGVRGEKIGSCWVPWSDHELGRAGGYGAGVAAPGWAAHLWAHEGPDSAVIWLGRAAALLRAEGHEITSAGVIDAVRMAEALTAVRGLTRPGLAELADALLTVFGEGAGEAGGLARVCRRMERGERIGRLPEGAPALPLVMDWQRQCRSLRLTVKPGVTNLELDLRRPLDLRRSRLLHRLALLGVTWATLVEVRRTEQRGGSFREAWRMVWTPEVSRQLIDAGREGLTIERAATAAVAKRVVGTAPNVVELVALFTQAGRAGLGAAVLPEPGPARTLGELIASGIDRLTAAPMGLSGRLASDPRGSLAGELARLMTAFAPLAELERHGSLYDFDPPIVTAMVDRMMVRIMVGFQGEWRANPSLSPSSDSVTGWSRVSPSGLGEFDYAVRRRGVGVERWDQSLRELVGRVGGSAAVAGLAGRATLLLWQAGGMTRDDLLGVLTRALNPGLLDEAAWWIEGFLADSGARLIHDPELFSVIDRWLAAIPAEHFPRLLPLLRRVFASLPRRVRRQILAAGAAGALDSGRTAFQRSAPDSSPGIDPRRAALVIPILNRLLGLDLPPDGGAA